MKPGDRFRERPQRGASELLGTVGIGAGRAEHLDLVHAGLREHDGAVTVAPFEQRRRPFPREQRGHHRRVHDPPHQGIVSIHLDADVNTGRAVGMAVKAASVSASSGRPRAMRTAAGRRSGNAKPGIGRPPTPPGDRVPDS